MHLRDHICEINKQTGEVIVNGSVIQLRPKTFELLLFLASNPNTIHSKSEILAAVWPNSVVEDQVIFQSINEIRKEIGIPEAIKTFPRRGYQLEVPTHFIDNKKLEKRTSISSFINKKTTLFYLFAIATLSIVVATIIYLTSNQPSTINNSKPSPHLITKNNTELSHKGILVLPFNVASLDQSQQWLRYGAMEGLIKKISPKNDITVFHLEDAIEILNRIDVGERDNIDKIFQKSGAFYILQTSVSGQPGELNVVYNIYSRTNKTTATLQATSLENLLTSLVNQFELTIGTAVSSNHKSFDQELQNNLIAKAMQFLEVNDLKSALPFIKSAAINDPSNIMAAYLLVKINLELNQVNEAMTAIDNAFENAEPITLNEYKHRLLFFKGAGFAILGQLNLSEKTLLESQRLSQDAKDWLYYAYTQSLLAKLKLKQKQFNDAYALYQSALKYQELLNCPMGIAQGYLDFADFYLTKGEHDLAQQNYSKAQAIFKDKNLKQLSSHISEIQNRLNASH